MRELVVENQEVIVIPQNFRFANRGKVTRVNAGDFILELDFPPEDLLENTYCEFYTQTSHGKLYFSSYAKSIEGKTLTIASPAKHRFLQRRRYTRIKFVQNLKLLLGNSSFDITTVDISAGGMKLKTKENINIEGSYAVTVPLFDNNKVDCSFEPIRVEKAAEGGYTISGQFVYKSSHDKMIMTQFCAKRSIEIKNK